MKIAVITGASSGLGAEFTKMIYKNYEDRLDEIWIIARRMNKLEQLANELFNTKVRALALDLTDLSSFTTLKKMFDEQNVQINMLINNAGYCGCGRFDEMSDQSIYTMIDLNMTALTMMNKCCFPYMKKGSFVILTCSVSSFVPVIDQAVYSASKAYVRFLGQSLHEEMKKKGVNVLTFCPGNMDTEMNVKGSDQAKVSNLPYLDLKKLTDRALKKAEAGKGSYTPGWFYKGYRLVSKIIPHALLIKATDGMF